MEQLVHLFFITFSLNVFIVFYFLYLFFDTILFHNLQGSKLNLKQQHNLK